MRRHKTAVQRSLTTKNLLCSKCHQREEEVEEMIEEVICHICCAHMGGSPSISQSVKQLVGPHKMKGWQFMNVFVDSEQRVYHKGIEQPELKGTLPITPERPKKSTFQRAQEKAQKEARLATRYEKKQQKINGEA